WLQNRLLQLGDEILHGRRTRLRLLLQRAMDHLLDFRRYVGTGNSERRRRSHQMLLHDGGNAGTFERYIAGQHLEEYDPKTVNVTSSISLFTGPLLRRHVSRRTNDANCLRSDKRTKQIG